MGKAVTVRAPENPGMPFAPSRQTAAPAQPAAASPLPSWAGLKAIADGQRAALIALGAGFLVIPLSVLFASGLGEESGGVAGAVVLVAFVWAVRIWMAVAVYRLARALGSRLAVLWAIGAFLPNIIGLVVLAVISSRATGRLRKAGLKVGLLGAKLPDQPPPGFLCQELERAFS